VRIKANAIPMDLEALLGSQEARDALAELKEALLPPKVTSARWLLLTHRPLPGATERFVTTYAINLSVDGLGIMPEEYLGHDGDVIPEFDLRTLFNQVKQRATRVDWRARVEVALQLKAGMLFDLSLRLPEGLAGEWTASADDPPAGQRITTAEELRQATKLRRRINIAGTFAQPEEIPDDDIKGRLGVISTALVDTPYEIESGWPVGINMTRYEWEG